VEWLHLKPNEVHLRPIQCRALATIAKHHGLFAPIGVGHGKTLVAWLAPLVLGNPRTVILIPSAMMENFKLEIERFKPFFRQPSPEPEIVPYSILSSASGTSLLSTLRPELIIMDEGHSLMHGTSARCRRFKRYLAENPNTICITLSGTFFAKKPSELAHLVQFSLRENAFMPVRGKALEVFSQCIDLDGKPNESDWSEFNKLARPEGINLDSHSGQERQRWAREALYSRMRTTPGVVTTIEASIDLPLDIHYHDIEIPPEIEQALQKVLTEEETPDGEDIIVDDATRARIQNYISCGFFYRWAWEDVGGKDHEWILARKVWGKALRRELEKNAVEGYDSPKLVANVVAGELVEDPGLARRKVLHSSWAEWCQHKNKPVPPTKAVWISDFYVQWIKDFVSDGVPTVIWYSSRAMGEALEAAGFPVYGLGTQVPDYKGQTVACSIRVHGEGKNGFQPWSRMLVVEPPSLAKKWEQLLGRHHRPGQKHASVEVHVPQHTNKFRKCLDDSIAGAYHTKELSGVDQRLLLAEHHNGESYA